MGSKNSKSKGKGEKFKRELKLVILGIAASGKSTFVRQLRVIHKSEWGGDEIQVYYDIVLGNLFDSLMEISNYIESNKIKTSKEIASSVEYYAELTKRPVLGSSEIDRINQFWNDKTIQAAYEEMKSSPAFGIYNMPYFMGRLNEIGAPNYRPSNDDILHLRQRSTGISETCFVSDKTKYTITDLGGQKPERAKWDRVLVQGYKGLFFFVAIDEYDVPSTEAKGKTKLEVSLDTWKETLSNSEVEEMSIILILNKVDLLEEKITKDFKSVTKQFPKYDKPETKQGVIDFIQALFIDSIPSNINLQYVAAYASCALDTNLITTLFDSAKKHILARAMNANFK